MNIIVNDYLNDVEVTDRTCCMYVFLIVFNIFYLFFEKFLNVHSKIEACISSALRDAVFHHSSQGVSMRYCSDFFGSFMTSTTPLNALMHS